MRGLRLCEDYDVYLRLAQRARWLPTTRGRRLSLARQQHVVRQQRHAEWVIQGMEGNGEKRVSGATTLAAWKRGRKIWKEYYAEET